MAQSLFGLTPEQIQEARRMQQQQAINQQAQSFGMFGPLYAAGRGMAQQGIGQLANLFPDAQQDPMLQQATALQGLRQQYAGVDLSDPNNLLKLATDLSGVGAVEQAMQVAQQARTIQENQQKLQADLSLKEAQTAKASRVTEAGQKGIVVPPGGLVIDPVTGRVIAEGTPQRAAEQKPSPESKRYNELIALGVDPERARAIAYKTESVDFRRELEESKQSQNREKKEAQQSSIISSIDNIMNTIGTAEKQISGLSSGTLGAPLSLIPGTTARDLASNLETIKANLGFDRLQQMRDASPTGGALGQVAVQELVALQSTVASLDIAQSPSQLKANLKKIQGHYQKWRDAVRKAQEQNQTTIGDLTPTRAEPSATPAQTPSTPAATQQPRRLRFNPTTGGLSNG